MLQGLEDKKPIEFIDPAIDDILGMHLISSTHISLDANSNHWEILLFAIFWLLFVHTASV